MKEFFLNMYPTTKQIVELRVQPNKYEINVELGGKKYLIEINQTAFEILDMCDGMNSVENIIMNLNEKYNSTDGEKFVLEFLQNMNKVDMIQFLPEKKEKKILVRGGANQYLVNYANIDITYDCPLKCKHCYVDAGKSRKKEHISFSDFQRVIWNLKKMGVTKVQISGGEPMCHPEIVKMLCFLRKNGMPLQLVTSGYIWNEKILKELAEWKKDISIQVSLDGNEREHNMFRGKVDAYERAVQFINKIMEMEIDITVATSLYHEIANIDYMLAFGKKIKELGVKKLRIGMILNAGRAQKNILASSSTDMKYLPNLISVMRQKLQDEKFMIVVNEELERKGRNCGAGYQLLSLDPKGYIYACPVLKTRLGNILELNSKKVFDKMKRFSSISKPCSLLCSGCEKEEFCKGCIAHGIMYYEHVKECRWYEANKKDLEQILEC